MESQEVISVTTNTAVLKVARQGRQGGPVILTFHDLGLNHVTNYKVREHVNNNCCVLFQINLLQRF